MRPVILPLCVFVAFLAAVGGVASAACRLTATECARALHEVAADADALAADSEVLGLGLSAPDRARALLRRDAERMAERLRRLPAPIGAEVMRLQACLALDGMTVQDPLCR